MGSVPGRCPLFTPRPIYHFRASALFLLTAYVVPSSRIHRISCQPFEIPLFFTFLHPQCAPFVPGCVSFGKNSYRLSLLVISNVFMLLWRLVLAYLSSYLSNNFNHANHKSYRNEICSIQRAPYGVFNFVSIGYIIYELSLV